MRVIAILANYTCLFNEFLKHRRRRADVARACARVGYATARTFARYFAAGEAFFRLREDSLYRVILKKRPKRKSWVRPLRPSDVEAVGGA